MNIVVAIGNQADARYLHLLMKKTNIVKTRE
jgi:hypothetical protein